MAETAIDINYPAGGGDRHKRVRAMHMYVCMDMVGTGRGWLAELINRL